MKKKFILGLMVCVMFLLVACGKHEVTVTVPNNATDEDKVEENQITKVERKGELTGTLKLVDCFALTGRG